MPTPTPLVSVALCTFNGARYLPQQLEALLLQSYPRIEIVAVDDCSTDETYEILDDYARRDARIRVQANVRNLGFKLNFERALSLCLGDLIAPCDQDDIWLAGKISALVEALGDNQLAYCDSTLVGEDGHATGPRMSEIVPMISTDDPVPFAFGNCVSGHAMLFRKELLLEALPIAEEFFHDWWIAAVAAAKGGIVFLPESLVLYRQHGSNITCERLGEMIAAAGLGAKPQGMPSQRPRGLALQRFRQTERRLAAIARLPGRHQVFAAELHAVWCRREHQWFSPRLSRLLLKHRHRLLRFANLSDKKSRRYAREAFYGLRIKRLTHSHAYSNS